MNSHDPTVLPAGAAGAGIGGRARCSSATAGGRSWSTAGSTGAMVLHAEGMKHRLFWLLIAMASLLEAIAAAAFATAVFSDPIPRGVVDYEPDSETEIFGRVVSLDWSSDREMLIATILFAALGLATYLAAARSR